MYVFNRAMSLETTYLLFYIAKDTKRHLNALKGYWYHYVLYVGHLTQMFGQILGRYYVYICMKNYTYIYVDTNHSSTTCGKSIFAAMLIIAARAYDDWT